MAMERREILAWRRAQRETLIAARMALPPAAHSAASAAIGKRLEEIFAPLPRTPVGAYWPFRREYNVLGFLDWLMERDHEVALPVVLGKGQPLEFRRWTRDTAMNSGVYDIPYPADGEPVWPAVLIIPVVGFDEAGFRLGYGGGFYDRTLATYAEKPLCLGTGFELGRLPTIHPLPHDIAMDEIVTEAARYRHRADNLRAR